VSKVSDKKGPQLVVNRGAAGGAQRAVKPARNDVNLPDGKAANTSSIKDNNNASAAIEVSSVYDIHEVLMLYFELLLILL
jgi:hypothetical protein